MNETIANTADRPGACEACEATVPISAEEISALFGKVAGIRGVQLVSASQYDKRIALCQSCDQLAQGHTCLLCGCLVQIKAKLAAAKCPIPFQPKW